MQGGKATHLLNLVAASPGRSDRTHVQVVPVEPIDLWSPRDAAGQAL